MTSNDNTDKQASALVDVPAGYKHWHGDRSEDHNGPFFFKLDGDDIATAFRVRPENCNAHNTLHGGILMMFADYTLCLAAIGGTHEGVVTVTCNNEFVGPAFDGDLVTGRGEVTRKGGSLIFARAVIEANGKTILTSSGVLKRVPRPASA
ncbi:PaaI family thioesterase [Pseudohongiella sp.]|uniref:Thioesterase domain-containing protein n=1 Tax=marine sediment metagenome TaxID=412755 RepID=A0A0F9Z5I0_9ZZZZ|nr:PaaI family thioesterase [Pseudohongiella sp.]